ncbi:MAG: LOG family protein [Candidatus Gracilibacteria bacterium]
MLRDLLATETPIELQRGSFDTVSIATQKSRERYERFCDTKQYYDLVMHFRVLIFGSARLSADTEEFQFVSDLAKKLVEKRRIDIITGGGPGIMEAAHYGLVCAKQEALEKGYNCKAQNIGVRVDLPFEQDGNSYVHINTKHRGFSTRLHAFITQSKAAYVAEGGIGSLLELAYLMQLKQVGHLEKTFPIIAHPCWEKPLQALNETFYTDRIAKGLTPTIGKKDLDLVTFSDDIKVITEIFVKEFDFWKKHIRSRVRLIGDLN